MKIVIAPDSFKESLSAQAVAMAIEAGFRAVFPDAVYVRLPMADGGEGTVDALVAASGGDMLRATVRGPLGDPVAAGFGLMGGEDPVAVIEMAAASGLMLLQPDRRNPLLTSTYGVGELIRAALDRGARQFIIGIGGSATNDGGMGMAQALGGRFLDADGQPLGDGGGALSALARIDMSGLDPRLKECRFQVACDVDNPLTGPKGASRVFGPQKGATPRMVEQLDDNLGRLARRIETDLGVAVDAVPGAGAAGGLGAAMVAFLGARLRPGVEIVAEAVKLEAALADADLVVTGEGRIDGQTIRGKTPMGVARIAKRRQKPVIGIAGSLGQDVHLVYDHGIDAVFGILPRPCTLAEALGEAAANLQTTARNVAAGLKMGSATVGWR